MLETHLYDATSNMPVDGYAKTALSVMDSESMRGLEMSMDSRVTNKLHSSAKTWPSQCTRATPSLEAKDRKTMASQLYIPPLPDMPVCLQQLANDAGRYVPKTNDVSTYCDATANAKQSPGTHRIF